MNPFQNLDLLSVGVAIAGTGILGFAVYSSNPKSITNRTFLYFSLTTIVWGVANYLHYQMTEPGPALWLLRLVLFFATWQSFLLFKLFLVFPEEQVSLPKNFNRLLAPLVSITAVLTLTPLVFSYFTNFQPGVVSEVAKGSGILVFAMVNVGMVIAGISTLIKKLRSAPSQNKNPLRFILLGTLLMFLLIITFSFILPAFLNNIRFVPLSALFIFPFIIFTFYAIVKHHLLNIKVITTEILTFVLATASILEVILSADTIQIIFRSGIFLLVLMFGLLLIKSVRREVEQKELLAKLNDELGVKNTRLTDLDRQKNEFLRVASHDLKSPVGLIKQWATLIDDGTYKEPAKVHETLEKIKSTADRSIQSVDDILDVNKIEEGRMDYTFEVRDIVPFVKGITEDYAPLAKAQKNIAVTFESPVKSANVKMDTTRLRQVIQNLMSNSFKYSEKGWIKVILTEEQKSILIAVKDSGLGMSAELLPLLFEQFRRDPGVEKKIQGTGLGLYISKLFTVAHGGEIWAESEGKGMGSTFFVRLPKA